MFTSVMGVLVLLRHRTDGAGKKDKARRRRVTPASEAVRILTVLLVGPVVVFGIYVVTPPGGGFQGGVILATAPLLVYLAGEFRKLAHIAPHRLLEVAEAAGVGAYVVIGAIGLISGLPFLDNVLPLGKTGGRRGGRGHGGVDRSGGGVGSGRRFCSPAGYVFGGDPATKGATMNHLGYVAAAPRPWWRSAQRRCWRPAYPTPPGRERPGFKTGRPTPRACWTTRQWRRLPSKHILRALSITCAAWQAFWQPRLWPC